MVKKIIESSNGKERRATPERRSGERRKPKPNSGIGVLTTRVTERRQKDRRKKGRRDE